MTQLSALFILSVVMVEVCVSADLSELGNTKHVWERRVNATLEIISSQKNCRFSGYNCMAAKNIPVRKMNLYTAEAISGRQTLVVVLPDKFKGQKSLRKGKPDIVIAIDPFPEASFGHTVLVFYIYKYKSKVACENMHGNFTVFSECITPARKRNCGNRLVRKRRRCEIDFIPLVYAANDAQARTQKLQCRDDLLGFGKCRTVRPALPVPCGNTPRCGNPPKIKQRICFFKSCDYAVLIAGGWNAQTNHPRYQKNLELFWNFLHRENNFSKDHITTFYGHDGSIELDGNASTPDAVPAVNEVSVRARVKDVCRLRSCVDTLVLYLTGPARSNGALLFWDENNDGLIESKEEYSFHDIMADLRKCTARRVFLVADYSYSGNLVHKFPGKRPSRKTVIFTSTSQHEYSWRSDFTEAFVHSSRSNKVVSMREIFQKTKRKLSHRQSKSHPRMTSENGQIANLTVYGGPSNVDKATERKNKGCQLLSPVDWRPQSSNHKRLK